MPLDDQKEGYHFILDANDDAEEQERNNAMDVDDRPNEDIDDGEADDANYDVEYDVDYDDDDDDDVDDELLEDEEEYGEEDGAEDETDRARKRQRQE